MKKWVVTKYAEDGNYEKKFTEFENALKYLGKEISIQVPKVFHPTEKQSILNLNCGRYTDMYGCAYTIKFTDVGTCKACKTTNKALNLCMHNGKKVMVCGDCYC